MGRNCHRLCGAEKLKKSPRNGETARDFINVLVLSEACQFKAQFTSNITVIIIEDSVTRTDFSESQAQSDIKKAFPYSDIFSSSLSVDQFNAHHFRKENISALFFIAPLK